MIIFEILFFIAWGGGTILMADFLIALIRYRIEQDQWKYPLDRESIKKVAGKMLFKSNEKDEE